MKKIAQGIVRLRKLILTVAFLLLIPSAIGAIATRINYDILTYLPQDLDSMIGEVALEDDFHLASTGMITVEGLPTNELIAMKKDIEAVPGVTQTFWLSDVIDPSIPTEMLPADVQQFMFGKNDSTMLIVRFDAPSASDETMEAVAQIEKLLRKDCFFGGMSVILQDTKALVNQEMPMYILIAVGASLLVLFLSLESTITPLLFMLGLLFPIAYNFGTNIFLGQISYITEALATVLQLGVTMDYSIFLLNSFEENKKRFPDDKERAMGHAIANTFKSVAGSSVTTVAGFLALCVMTFALGRDLGIVMAKGVLIGVVCCVTVLPAMVLVFDKAIEKTRHKPLVKSLDKPSAFITKHYKVWVVIFLVLLFPSIYGNNHTQIYYNIARSLPSTLDCNVANDEVKAQFNVSNMHIVMMDRDMDSKQKKKMMEEIGNVKGVKSTISMSSLLGPTIPESMIPENLRSMLQSDEYELAFVSSEYESATDEVNEQVKAIDKIVKSYDKNGMVIGEAPLMKDLQDVTDADLVNVNVLSIGAIFIIILLIFKSISLPIILVAVIEFAIMLNMAIPYYQGTSLPFVASIVIGAIQLGATVDYAILMTTRYQKERQNGKDKKEAISIAHKTSMPSIISSGLSFFAATFGVACYSQVEMIGSICTLLARGAIISMVVVILILPAMFMIFDKLICKTSIGFLKKKTK